MKFLSIILLMLFTACSVQLTPSEVAVLYMKNRYFNPSQAYRMLKPGIISKEKFMLRHEEMLRIKDYKLNHYIHFKVTKLEQTKTAATVTVETTRPDLRKIFANFYQEKLMNNWDKKKIKEKMLLRLKDPKAPVEKLQDNLTLEKTSTGWRVIFKD